ncbi:MAG: WG repeat-containing protein [Paludibacter sp.]
MSIKYLYKKIINRISKSLEIRMISDFKFDEVGDFHAGMAKVKLDKKWGFVNEQGLVVIDCQYEDAGDFHQGRAMLKSKGKWGFIDKRGNVRVSFMFDEVSNFSHGVAKVTQFKKHFYINKCGNQISSLKFGREGRFHLLFRLYEIITKKKKQSVQIYKNTYNYRVSSISKDGYRWATIDESHFGYINEKGNLKIKMQYDKAFDFNEKRARVELNGKIGFINRKNKRVIPIEYDTAAIQFKNGLLRVSKHEKHGFVNINNREIIRLKYDRTINFNQGLAGVSIAKKWGFIDLFDNQIIPLKYEDCRSFNDGIAGVKSNDKWGFICIPRKQSIFSIMKGILFTSKKHNQFKIEPVINNSGVNDNSNNEATYKLTPRQQKLTEIVESLKNLSDEMTDYLDKKTQEELVPNWQRKKRISINEDACILFLQKYGKGELTDSMRKFANSEGNTINDKYKNWLKWSKVNNKNFGGNAIHLKSKMFDIDETIYEYEWDGIEGGWLEIFQYIYDIEHSS